MVACSFTVEVVVGLNTIAVTYTVKYSNTAQLFDQFG